MAGSGFIKFLDQYRLVIKNVGSGNISGVEELADEIFIISPELEGILLTQYLDTCSSADWFVYYFVVTGEPDGYGREETETLIAEFGGVVRGAVSGKTNFLIVGDYVGEAKIAKAKEIGTQIIDVEEFEKMISDFKAI